MNKKIVLTLALALGVAQPALAHGSMKPTHGGVAQMSGETLFELVNKPGAVAVFVTDDEEPVAASRMSGNMTVTAAGKTSTVALRPAAGNRFDAPGARIPKGAKVGVTVVDKASQTRLGTIFASVK